MNIMLAYLMLFAALSNADILYIFIYFFAIDFCKFFSFHALSWFNNTWFVYFKYYFASCAVLLICWFFLNNQIINQGRQHKITKKIRKRVDSLRRQVNKVS